MDLFDDDVPDWQPKPLPPIRGGLVALDFETKDEGIGENKGPGWPWGGGYVVGAALAWEGAQGYFPVRHASGGNMDEQAVLCWLLELMDNKHITWCFANASYDLGWLRRWAYDNGMNFTMPAGPILDVQIMAPLLDENRPSYSLDALGRHYLGERKDEDLMKRAAASYGIAPRDVKKFIWRLPAPAVAPYGEQDAALTRRLTTHLLQLIHAENLHAPSELEHALVPVLLDMRWRGIRANVERARVLGKQYGEKEKAAISAIRRTSGIQVDMWSADSVARALMHEGITPPRSENGKFSITKDYLKSLVTGGSEIAVNVLLARKYQKSRGTFVDGHILGHAIQRGNDWRLFPEFHQLRSERDGGSFGTVSMRFSCSNPNFQQFPSRDAELLKDLRGCLEPEEGDEWGCADFNQQEPRLGINFAEGAQVPGGKEAADAIRNDPTWDFHRFASECTGVARDDVKQVSLGRLNGGGAGMIAQKLGLPWTEEVGWNGKPRVMAGEETLAIIEKYDAGMPWMAGMSELAKRRAQSRGFITLLGGYKRRFARNKGERGSWPKDAFNALMQGSGAVQMKRAMVDGFNAGLKPLGVVHDDSNVSLRNEQDKKIMVEVMQNSYSDVLRVPFKVTLKTGKTWADCK